MRGLASAFCVVPFFVIQSVSASAQDLSAEIKSKYPDGVYTSAKEYNIPKASCESCKADEKGDEYRFDEVIPYKMNPKTARMLCRRDPSKTGNDDNPCVFNTEEVTINNPGKTATIIYRSRSEAVIIKLQTDIIGD